MSKLNVYNEYVIAPGETILELLESNGMSQLGLAYKTGINKKTINEIVRGKAPITPTTALKFEYVFNISASFFNNLESSYQEVLERKNDFIKVKEEEKYLENIPYNEMAKRGWDWIEKINDPFQKVINLRKFFSVASLTFDTELKKKLAFRKKNNDKFSNEALYCYLRYGEIESNKVSYPNFNILLLNENLSKLRKLANDSFIKQFNKLKEILFSCGISLIFEPELPQTYINGVSYMINPNKAIIMLSDRGKKDDIIWFTFFHEIGHLLKHSRKEVFVDLDNKEENNIEKEADKFARNILIPDKSYNEFIRKNKVFTEENLKDFSKRINILPGILVGRLQKDGLIKWNEFNYLKN